MTITLLGRKLPKTAIYASLLAAGIVVLLTMIGAAFWQANEQHRRSAAVSAAIELRTQARQILLTVQAAETGQRTYLLTNDREALAPLRDAERDLPAQLLALENATADWPDLHDAAQRLRTLTESKLAELNDGVRLRRGGRGERAAALVRTGLGAHLTGEIRELVAYTLASERRSVEAELGGAAQASGTLRWIVVLGALMLAGLAALAAAAVRADMAQLRTARDQALAARERMARDAGARRQAEYKISQASLDQRKPTAEAPREGLM